MRTFSLFLMMVDATRSLRETYTRCPRRLAFMRRRSSISSHCFCPLSPNFEVACSPHRWMSSFQEGTRFNRMFLWCFQPVKLRGVEGPPDLVIEVVSPSNRSRDLLTKRALYGRAGVREYWLVDPEARTIEILALDRDAFHLAVAASGDETPVSPLLGQLPITANELFADIDA